MVFLGCFVNAAGIVWLSDKGLAHTFYRRSSPWPVADFFLVVSNPSVFVIIFMFYAGVQLYLSGLFSFVSTLSKKVGRAKLHISASKRIINKTVEMCFRAAGSFKDNFPFCL